MKEYALQYASLGFSVIPISKDKKPMIKFADKAALNHEEIETIWRQYPKANIGLKTDKFFVIDLDIHDDKKNGYESFKGFLKKDWWINTLSQTTASGGKQYFFKKREDMAIRQKIGWIDGVDVKANKNNYVLVPPSMTIKGQYRWDNSKQPIKLAPKELVIEIMKSTEIVNQYPSRYQSNGYSKVAKLFDTICNGFGEKGCRNDSLTSFIAGLLYRDINVNVIFELSKIANQRTSEPMDKRELEKTFYSMLKKESRRRGWTE